MKGKKIQSNYKNQSEISKSRKSQSPEHFSSSAFLNSPDPSKLPIPVFDDEPIVLSCSPTSPSELHLGVFAQPDKAASISTTKTETLRQFLNLRTQL